MTDTATKTCAVCSKPLLNGVLVKDLGGHVHYCCISFKRKLTAKHPGNAVNQGTVPVSNAVH